MGLHLHVSEGKILPGLHIQLAGGLESCSQLPLKLALFLETDFKTVKDVPLIPKTRIVYNSKCFLQLMSLLARSFPAKMLLYSTPPTWAFWALVS